MINRLTAARLVPAALAALLLGSAAALADGHSDDWGPATGGAPLGGLTATAPDGNTVELEALSAKGNGLVVAFVRSADWCPFCKRQLIELSQRHADFAKRGLTLVSVSYDDTGILTAFGKEFDIAYPMLSDPESTIIDAFGIRNESHKPGTAGYGIPHPGIMVFDTDGVLVEKFAEKSYKERPRIDDVLAAIDARR